MKTLSATTERIEMPDMDSEIQGWRKEIHADLFKKCLFKIPDGLDREIEKYRAFREMAGLPNLNKEEVIMHFCKLGIDHIEYPK